MRELVTRKLEILSGYLERFSQFECRNLGDESRDSPKQFACERVYELLVEAAADINQELCMHAGREIPDSYRNSFIVLGELGILEDKDVDELAATTRLRNRLVHDYEDTDRSRIRAEFNRAPELFIKYVSSVKSYIEEIAVVEE